MTGKKIVAVDDDTTVRKLVEVILKKAGYEVLVACNGEEGLERIKELKPDAVILDIMMPKLEGLDVLNELKQKESTRDIPVIMLTSMGEEEDVQKGMFLGASRYLPKPVDGKKLLQSLEEVLG